MNQNQNTGKVFLIAGSEPLGSAGVQADIKAITRCGGWAAAALTAIVDEDVNRIKGVYPLPADLVVSQVESFLSTVGADCIKTGVLPATDIIRGVAQVIRQYRQQPVIVDPVLVNYAGSQLISDECIELYREQLFPLATLITPNRNEAEFLLARPLDDIHEDLRELASWGCSVLVKSVEREDYLVDYLYDVHADKVTSFPKRKLHLTDRNGTGDTLSSAVATYLALGMELQTAVRKAEDYMHHFLSSPRYVISSGLGMKQTDGDD